MDPRTIYRGAFIGLLMLVAASLEACGLGLVYTFIRALLSPDMAVSVPLVGDYFSNVQSGGSEQTIIMIVGMLLAVFLIKNVLLIFLYFIQAGFIARNESILAIKLLDHYLHGAYSLHITRNSADLIRNMTGSVSVVFNAVTMSFFTLASELVVSTTIGIVLIILQPVYTIGAICILGTAIGIFYAYSRARVHKWGFEEQEAQSGILKALQQGFHSIKEVKILGCENAIHQSFIKPRMALARCRVRFATMAQAPRLWTETVVVATILISVLVVLSGGGRVEEIVSALALFGAATFRLLPSMNRMILAMNAIRGGTHAVNFVYDDTVTFANNPDISKGPYTEPLRFDKELVADDVTFRYSASDQPVLQGVSLSIRPGESIGVIGPSGAGKTTLIDVLVGLMPPTSGTISVDGHNVYDDAGRWRRQLGYVPQSIYLTDDTLRRNIAFGQPDDNIDEAQLARAINLAQLEEIVRKLPDGLDTKLGDRGIRLSGGQRQRVGIARALYNDPSVLIFDEATSSLDTETEHEVNNAIQTLKGSKTLIVIAHRLTTVRQCNRLIYLKNGRVEDIGTFDELAARHAGFSKLVELAQL